MEEEFERIFNELYPDGKFQEHPLIDWDITEKDVECFERFKKIVETSANSQEITPISNAGYYFL